MRSSRAGNAAMFVLAAAAAMAPLAIAAFMTPTAHQWGQRANPRSVLLSRSTSTTRFFFSAVANAPAIVREEEEEVPVPVPVPSKTATGPMSGEEINARLAAQLEKLRLKDQTSRLLTKEELNVVYEDDHIVVVGKPAGVLTVAGKDKSNKSLAQAVFEHASNVELANADGMVVHRLGMDTSGLLVLAKTTEAVRGLNTAFRTRKVERTYEALVCGHVARNRGLIDLPLMRDYACPPYMRISTDEHQEALVDLDPEVVGKKLLEQPKESLTRYEVIAREELNGQPVTRVRLTSISGRTHQLNCHLAAFGHPIVGDTVYGLGGDAAPNGGLTNDELQYLAPNPARATMEQQQGANAAVAATACHAQSIRFRHPVTKQQVSLTLDAPF